jgi:hypothetical protein
MLQLSLLAAPSTSQPVWIERAITQIDPAWGLGSAPRGALNLSLFASSLDGCSR